eukprot:gene4408-6679_t
MFRMVVGYLGNVEVKAYRVSGIFPCCFGQPLTRTRRAVHVLPSLSNPAIRSYLERVLEKRRLLQDAILEEAKKGDSASMVEKTRLLAQTDELAQAANRWFELTQLPSVNFTSPPVVFGYSEPYLRVKIEIERVEPHLLDCLVPRDEADGGSAIVEIRAGTGGAEAAIFAADLLSFYERLAARRGWRIQHMTASFVEGISDTAIKEITCSFNGTDVFGTLKFESGVHRVQRVPATETAGRIHTSTATVVVLPQPTEVHVSLNERDIRMDTYRSGGAGGQHVNTTDSAVRLTHIPTGIIVANRDTALKMLRAKIYQHERERVAAERSAQRRALIGGQPGARSERIRTYNYAQDRVTDHRVNVQITLSSVLNDCGLDDIIVSLRQVDHMERLLNELEDQSNDANYLL